MLTSILHALFNSSVVAAFSYLLLQTDAVQRSLVPALLPSKILTGGSLRKGLATQ